MAPQNPPPSTTTRFFLAPFSSWIEAPAAAQKISARMASNAGVSFSWNGAAEPLSAAATAAGAASAAIGESPTAP